VVWIKQNRLLLLALCANHPRRQATSEIDEQAEVQGDCAPAKLETDFRKQQQFQIRAAQYIFRFPPAKLGGRSGPSPVLAFLTIGHVSQFIKNNMQEKVTI